MANTNYKNYLKIAVAVVLVTLVIIVVLQNTEPVETRLLFASVTMPRAALLAGTTAVGFLSGWLFGKLRKRG